MAVKRIVFNRRGCPYIGIAFAGKMGAGKTTLAMITQAFLGPRYLPKVHRFAEPLKEALPRLLGRPIDKKKPEDRLALQRLADLIKDIYGDLHFTNLLKRKILYDLASHPDFDVFPIVDDVRFPHEVEMLKGIGILTVEVRASDEIRRSRISIHSENHASETALDGYRFKYHITNEGTLDDARSAIEDLLRTVFEFSEDDFKKENPGQTIYESMKKMVEEVKERERKKWEQRQA